MNITQKGLILVCVPLVLQLLVVGFMLNRLFVFDAERQKELEAKKAVTLTLESGFTFSGTCGALYLYALIGRPELLLPYETGCAMQAQKLAQLDPIVAKRFPGNKVFQDYKERMAANSKLQSEFISEIGKGPNQKVPALLAYGTLFFAHMMRILEDVDKLSTQFNDDAARQAARSKKAWEQQKITIWGGIALSTLMTIAMAQFFSRGVTRRIKTVRENTVLLAQNKTLLPPLGGKDEIGNLDQFFHQMAQRMAAATEFKRGFYAMVSHDLRNPLTSVKGLLELVGMGAFGDVAPQAEDSIAQALSELDQLLVLINDILDMEKLEAGQMPLLLQPVQFPAAIQQAIAAVTARSSEDVEIKWDCPSLVVRADGARLERALTALISCALLRAARGSQPLVRVRESNGELQIAIAYQSQQASDQEELFNLGSSSKENIGLSLGKLIVELHGGQLSLKPDEDNKACLSMNLPLRLPA